MVDQRLLALALALGLLVVPAGSAAAANEESLETPIGTFYVDVEVQQSEPSIGTDSQDLVCIGGGGLEETCVTVLFPTVDPGVSVDVRVYEESNGCDGLQTQTQDCDDDGEEESPDERVLPDL